ncbi:MAG: hypothetical protein PWQ91_596 [Eubacteriales bacterium]|nr:hypothetical protein [Eubacteriales bacterium]
MFFYDTVQELCHTISFVFVDSVGSMEQREFPFLPGI